MFRQNPQQETVQLAGYTVDITRKRIKNLILRVSNAEGRLRLSLPWRCSLAQAEAFIQSRREWIERQQKHHNERSGQLERKYKNGEITYLWGTPYILCHKGQGDTEQALYQYYRKELAREVAERLPYWQEKLGIEKVGWHIRKMKSRWGSCQTRKRELTINLHLARYPLRLLDYLLVHELMHLHEPSHNRNFYALMDRAMPDWKARRKQLRQPLPLEGEPIVELCEEIQQEKLDTAEVPPELAVDKIRPLLII